MFIFAIFLQKIDFEQSQFQKVAVAPQFFVFVLVFLFFVFCFDAVIREEISLDEIFRKI